MYTMDGDYAPLAATGIAHMILAAMTGWSLKHLGRPQMYDSSLIYTMMWCLMLYSLLGMIRFSHPYPHQMLRAMYDRAALIARVCPLPILTAQLYLTPHPSAYIFSNDQSLYVYYNSLAYTFFMSAIVAYIAYSFFTELNQRHIANRILTGVLMLNAMGLSLIGCQTGNYWASGLVVSFMSKHFMLPILAERYRLPYALLYTYGLIFYEVFAVNAMLDAHASYSKVII
ncbi:uncharacterized protein LOC128729191 [Anopheles nili]|uniref:uncharacterized protein LOC128729191 n=1 Tax=Anopheles nili TaxID=185578 RepID=UPI00237AF268|nr:uncharacterized protein LOC128729191 [Anopheles nili]